MPPWRANSNMSMRKPMTSAPMNNNPMGVQRAMSPVTPGIRPIAPTAPVSPVAPSPFSPPSMPGGGGQVGTRPPGGSTGGRAPGFPFPVVTGPTVSPLPSRAMMDRFGQTPFGLSLTEPAPEPGVINPNRTPKLNMAPVGQAAPMEQGQAQPLATAGPTQPMQQGQAQPLATAGPTQPMQQGSPALTAMQGMVDRLRPGAENIRSLQQQTAQSLNRPVDRLRVQAAGGETVLDPNAMRAFTGSHIVNGSGSLSPRIATPMGRNVAMGQPPDADLTPRPLNIPATDYYGSRGIIPGSGIYGQKRPDMSPDDYRVLTGGKPMFSPRDINPSLPANDPNAISGGNPSSATRTTLMNRRARQQGVRGSDIAQWRQLQSVAATKPNVADSGIPGDYETATGDWSGWRSSPAQAPVQTDPAQADTEYTDNPGSILQKIWRSISGMRR